MQQQAVVLVEMEQMHLAEKIIQDAIAVNSSLPDSWHVLARILEFQDNAESSMKCYQTCLQLEATTPILPFTALTRIF
jgi:Tfp pilus assembly protein PilF